MAGDAVFKSVRRAPQGLHYPSDAKKESFRVELDPGEATVVAPVGELDMATVDELEGAMRQALDRGCRHLVLDLRGLSFMDSQGLHLVMRWNSSAEQSGFAFAVIQGGPRVRRLFEIVGLLDQLPFLDSIGDGPATSGRAPVAAEAVPLGVAQPAIRDGTAFALEASSAKKSLDHAERQSTFERNGEISAGHAVGGRTHEVNDVIANVPSSSEDRTAR